MEGIDGRLAAQLGSDVSAEGTAVTHRGVRLGVSDPTVDINDQFDRKSDREQCVGISITAELVFSGRPIQPQPERHRLPRRLRLASVAATSRGSGGPSRLELIPEHNAARRTSAHTLAFHRRSTTFGVDRGRVRTGGSRK
jgi:hypothetical protein